MWKNMKATIYPRQQPNFIKTYYSCINAENKPDRRCVKHVYVSKKNQLDVIVCYIGKLGSSF